MAEANSVDKAVSDITVDDIRKLLPMKLAGLRQAVEQADDDGAMSTDTFKYDGKFYVIGYVQMLLQQFRG